MLRCCRMPRLYTRWPQSSDSGQRQAMGDQARPRRFPRGRSPLATVGLSRATSGSQSEDFRISGLHPPEQGRWPMGVGGEGTRLPRNQSRRGLSADGGLSRLGSFLRLFMDAEPNISEGQECMATSMMRLGCRLLRGGVLRGRVGQSVVWRFTGEGSRSKF